jgi:nucleoid-associated protein YgaU
MPNDAKLGLIVGVGLVVAVAVVFFRKDPSLGAPLAQASATAAVQSARALQAHGPYRSVPAKKTMRPTESRRHTVQEGETLAGLAEHYYGDRDKIAEICRANPEVLNSPEPLNPGTVLTIPDALSADGAAPQPAPTK